MKKTATLLKKIGLYNKLLSIKRAFDKYVYLRREKIYFAKRIPFYKQFLKNGDLVFDVGANIGNRVSAFLEIGCKVIAVEPQQSCINVLKEKFHNKIVLVEKGLGEKEEKKTLYVSDSNTISSLSKEWIDSVKDSRFKGHQWNNKTTISLTTLENLISQYGTPTFCKIDVEGYELEVLKGLKQTIKNISIEYTVPEQSANLLECLQYCNQINPNYQYNYSQGEEMEFELKQSLPYQHFVRLVNEKKFIASGFGDIYIQLK